MKNKKIIITGFEPFGNYQFNPTQDLVQELHNQILGKYVIYGITLPSVYNAFPLIQCVIEKEHISGIISMGLASRVKGIRFETMGRNINNSNYADNNGLLLQNLPIDQTGKEYYKTTVKNNKLKYLCSVNGIPSEISSDAEGFICNDILYRTAQNIKINKLKVSFCFIHVPWTDDYKSKVEIAPEKITLSKELIKKALEIICLNIV